MKKIISLMMAVLLVVSLVPAMSAMAVDISPTFDVTLDANGQTNGKDSEKKTGNFDIWTTTVTGGASTTVKGDWNSVTTNDGNIVLPLRTHSSSATTSAIAEGNGYNFIGLSDSTRNGRVVDSMSFTISLDKGFLERTTGIVVGFYEENGYIVGVRFNSFQQLDSVLFTGTHVINPRNGFAEVVGNKKSFYDQQVGGNSIAKQMEVTYTFKNVYDTDGYVTKIQWSFVAKRIDGSDTPFYVHTLNSTTEVGTEYIGKFEKSGTIKVSDIKTSTWWLGNANLTAETGKKDPDAMSWNKDNCSPVIISGSNTTYSTIKSVTYTLQKTQAEYDAEAAEQVPAAVNSAYAAFEEDKSLTTADAFLSIYKQLPSDKLAEFADKYATVTEWINQQYVTNGTFTYKTAEVAAYPNVKEYLEENNFDNALDNGMVQSATAVFDKEALKTVLTSSTPKLLWLNETSASVRGNGTTASITGFGLYVTNQTDRYGRKTLLLYNTIGDAQTIQAGVSNWEIAKTNSGYGKLDWYTKYQVPDPDDGNRLKFDYEEAGKTDQVNACASTADDQKYLALSYTVNYEDVADKSYTKMYFQIKFWVDNGNGIYEENEVILTEETKTSRAEALLYNYKDGSPRSFEFGGIDDAAKDALVSLTLKNDFVADYSAVYGTTPKADTVKLEDIVAMKNDLDAVYPAFVSDAIRQQANAAYASILPTGNGATVRTDINQNLAFYGVRPAFFTGCENNATYQANLASAKSFGAVFQSYNTMVADENDKELTTANHGGNIVKSYTDGDTIANDAELLFTLSNIDVKSTDKWGYWIVARFYVTYEIDGNLVTLYSEGAPNKPETADGLTDAQASGTTIRSVNGILNKLYTAVTENKETYATYTGATVEKYQGKTLTEGLEIYKAAYNSAASAADKSLELCNFLIAYKGVVDAIVNAPQ